MQTAIQDVIAPSVRELKVRMAAFGKQSETQFQALRELIHSVLQEQHASWKALLAAFGEA